MPAGTGTSFRSPMAHRAEGVAAPVQGRPVGMYDRESRRGARNEPWCAFAGSGGSNAAGQPAIAGSPVRIQQAPTPRSSFRSCAAPPPDLRKRGSGALRSRSPCDGASRPRRHLRRWHGDRVDAAPLEPGRAGRPRPALRRFRAAKARLWATASRIRPRLPWWHHVFCARRLGADCSWQLRTRPGR